MKATRWLAVSLFAATATWAFPFANGGIEKVYGEYQQILGSSNPLLERILRSLGQSDVDPGNPGHRESYEKSLADKKRQLGLLLRKIAAMSRSDESDWLQMKILAGTDHFPQALALCEKFITAASGLEAEAGWEKVKILNQMARISESLPLFRRMEASRPRDTDLCSTWLFYALNGTTPAVRQEYGQKFLQSPLLPESLRSFRSQVYRSLARGALASRDAQAAQGFLERALAEERRPSWRTQLKKELEQIGMLHKPAPQLSAENWMNPLPSGAWSKVRSQALLFWAFWSEPSCQELLFLKNLDRRFAARGLQVSACIRLYGTSEAGPRGAALKMAEESQRIQGRLSALGITFPVLVSPEGSEFAAYRVATLPTLVLIDRTGQISDILVPTDCHDEIIDQISRLLGD